MRGTADLSRRADRIRGRTYDIRGKTDMRDKTVMRGRTGMRGTEICLLSCQD